MLFTTIFVVVLLVFCWLSNEVGLTGKLLLTLLFAGAWGLLYVNPTWVIVAHCVLGIAIGGMTFGTEFLTRRR